MRSPRSVCCSRGCRRVSGSLAEAGRHWRRDGYSATFVHRLILPAYQQALARWLIDGGIAVRLFGRGWDELEEFASHHAGEIPDRAALCRAVEASTALVHVWPGNGASDRCRWPAGAPPRFERPGNCGLPKPVAWLEAKAVLPPIAPPLSAELIRRAGGPYPASITVRHGDAGKSQLAAGRVICGGLAATSRRRRDTIWRDAKHDQDRPDPCPAACRGGAPDDRDTYRRMIAQQKSQQETYSKRLDPLPGKRRSKTCCASAASRAS